MLQLGTLLVLKCSLGSGREPLNDAGRYSVSVSHVPFPLGVLQQYLLSLVSAGGNYCCIIRQFIPSFVPFYVT